MNAAAVPAQIITGALCDRFPYALVMLGSASIAAIVTFALLRVSDSMGLIAAYAVLLGLTVSGGAACLRSVGSPRLGYPVLRESNEPGH